ncbi:MAG: hypothetical protein FJ144_16940 [Deltaproteobacteria bacterium]|nr:hypothetical protein [Deltaproteobacteria bacterium]
MKRRTFLRGSHALGIVSLLGLAGCAAGLFQVNPVVIDKPPTKSWIPPFDDKVEPVDLSTYHFVGDSGANLAYVQASTGPHAQAARNRLRAVLLRRSDAICDRHKAAIIGDASVRSAFLKIAGLGLSAAGTVAGGEATKTAPAHPGSPPGFAGEAAEV